MVTVSVRTGPQVVGYLSQVSLYYYMRNYRQRTNFCLSLTTSSSIPCGHNDREGASVARKCFQGDRNGPVSFVYKVGGMAEPHRNGHCKGNRQSCMTILMWLSGAHNGYVNNHTPIYCNTWQSTFTATLLSNSMTTYSMTAHSNEHLQYHEKVQSQAPMLIRQVYI